MFYAGGAAMQHFARTPNIVRYHLLRYQIIMREGGWKEGNANMGGMMNGIKQEDEAASIEMRPINQYVNRMSIGINPPKIVDHIASVRKGE